MKTNTILKCTAVAFVATILNAQAQVKFKVTRAIDLKTYKVSMVPEKTLKSNESVIGTMQVTIRVDADRKFQFANLRSANPEAEFLQGSVLHAPQGSNQSDYYSISLKNMGTKAFNFNEGEEIELFSFENNGTDIEARAELLDNNDDELVKFSKNQFNIQNHISVLGFGRKNAYTGNLSADEIAKKLKIQRLYPNPVASEEVTVEWENLLDNASGELLVVINDATTGREISKQQGTMKVGRHQVKVDIKDIEEGAYYVTLVKDGVKIGTPQKLFVAR